jgi:tetratricopeptide (TPR) repeat protein
VLSVKEALQLVRDLLASRNWEAAILGADHLLADSESSTDQQAFCHYARCRALSNLDRYGVALEPGRQAVQLATATQDWDLLGKTLLELGWIYYNLKLYEDAISVLTRFLEHLPQFGDDARSRQVDVLIDLGSNYRALEDHELALSYFTQAWELSGQPDSQAKPETAERARSQAVWEAIKLGRLDIAEQLLPAGDRYVEAFPEDDRGVAGHYIDQAQFSLLTKKWECAQAWAMKAIPHAKKHPELIARVFLIVYNVSTETGRYDDALSAALVALQAAQRDSRHDLVSEAQAHLDQLRLRVPEMVVLKFAETLRSPEIHQKGR